MPTIFDTVECLDCGTAVELAALAADGYGVAGSCPVCRADIHLPRPRAESESAPVAKVG